MYVRAGEKAGGVCRGGQNGAGWTCLSRAVYDTHGRGVLDGWGEWPNPGVPDGRPLLLLPAATGIRRTFDPISFFVRPYCCSLLLL
jgi:hypothetical protein